MSNDHIPIRLVGEAGFELSVTPRVEFVEVVADRGRPIWVPAVLPRLPLDEALATLPLPLHLNWPDPGRRFVLRDRRERGRVYEIVLREGGPADLLTYVDGALLVDLWEELVRPASELIDRPTHGIDPFASDPVTRVQPAKAAFVRALARRGYAVTVVHDQAGTWTRDSTSPCWGRC